jgi:hypothetical protein
MSAYENNESKAKEFFNSSAGFVFVERGVSWILTEVFYALFARK